MAANAAPFSFYQEVGPTTPKLDAAAEISCTSTPPSPFTSTGRTCPSSRSDGEDPNDAAIAEMSGSSALDSTECGVSDQSFTFVFLLDERHSYAIKYRLSKHRNQSHQSRCGAALHSHGAGIGGADLRYVLNVV